MAHHPETVLSVRAEAMQDEARLSVVEDDGFVCKRYLSRLSSAGTTDESSFASVELIGKAIYMLCNSSTSVTFLTRLKLTTTT